MGVRQRNFLDLLDELKFKVEKRNFYWLTNKITPSEKGLWRIFSALGGDAEAMQSKGSRRLPPDGYLPKFNCIIEFDELQHFTEFRLQTLLHYPADMYLGFDIESYRSWCDEHSIKALKKGLQVTGSQNLIFHLKVVVLLGVRCSIHFEICCHPVTDSIPQLGYRNSNSRHSCLTKRKLWLNSVRPFQGLN